MGGSARLSFGCFSAGLRVQFYFNYISVVCGISVVDFNEFLVRDTIMEW